MYGLVGTGIAVAGRIGAARRVRGVAENIIFAERAPPGALQNTIFAERAPPGALQNNISAERAPRCLYFCAHAAFANSPGALFGMSISRAVFAV